MLCRVGLMESLDEKDPEDEVNEYLMRAIDARSIDRLRAEHCKAFLLTFRRPEVEDKVSVNCVGVYVCVNGVDWHSHCHPLYIVLQYSKERDRMLSTYFCCSFFVFVSIVVVQLTVIPQ